MATVFTVAPSNRSNTEVQNKGKEFPIVSKQEHFASMVFHRTRKTTRQKEEEKKKRFLEKGGECGGKLTYAHVHGRTRGSSHVSLDMIVWLEGIYIAQNIFLKMEYFGFTVDNRSPCYQDT